MELLFVKALASDIPLIGRLADTIWHDHYPSVISVAQIDYMLETMYAPSVIAAELAGGVRYELMTLAGAAVGFLSYSLDAAAGVMKVHKVYLSVDCHGRGMGQQALIHLIEAARDNDCGEISLFVNKRNEKAVRAYMRAGFSVAESVVTDIGRGFVMDDFRMVYRMTARAPAE